MDYDTALWLLTFGGKRTPNIPQLGDASFCVRIRIRVLVRSDPRVQNRMEKRPTLAKLTATELVALHFGGDITYPTKIRRTTAAIHTSNPLGSLGLGRGFGLSSGSGSGYDRLGSGPRYNGTSHISKLNYETELVSLQF